MNFIPNGQLIKSNHANAVKIQKVEGGYIAFETWQEYEAWRNQK
jgi:hypothetical protein